MTNSEKIAQPIVWMVSFKEIGDILLKHELVLDEAQCASLGALLDIESFSNFVCKLELAPLRRRRYRLKGQILANFSQASSISLKPLLVDMNEVFNTEFWPIDQNDPEKSPELELDYADEMIEFYEGSSLDVGRVVYEQFAVALDPHLSDEGEVFEWKGQAPLVEEKVNPFAVLKNLKDMPDN